MGFRVPGTEIPGTRVPGTANPRDSWDLGQISLGVPGTGTVKFCCPTALGLCWTILDNRPMGFLGPRGQFGTCVS